jgi:hypothetical protein
MEEETEDDHGLYESEEMKGPGTALGADRLEHHGKACAGKYSQC